MAKYSFSKSALVECRFYNLIFTCIGPSISYNRHSHDAYNQLSATNTNPVSTSKEGNVTKQGLSSTTSNSNIKNTAQEDINTPFISRAASYSSAVGALGHGHKETNDHTQRTEQPEKIAPSDLNFNGKHLNTALNTNKNFSEPRKGKSIL